MVGLNGIYTTKTILQTADTTIWEAQRCEACGGNISIVCRKRNEGVFNVSEISPSYFQHCDWRDNLLMSNVSMSGLSNMLFKCSDDICKLV